MKLAPRLLEEVSQGHYQNFREWLNQTQIDCLDLSQGIATNVHFQHLGVALQGTSVREIDLSHNALDFTHATAIGEMLISAPIQEINLSFNYLKSCGVGILSGYLPRTALTTMHLSVNSITSKGIIALASGCLGSKMIRLSLNNNKIDSKELHTVFESFAGSDVSEVSLATNGIRVWDHHWHLAKTKIRKLNLAGNYFGLQQPNQFIAAFENNALLEIDLRNSAISGQWAKSFLTAVQSTSLAKIDLRLNDISAQDTRELAQCLENAYLNELLVDHPTVELTEALQISQLNRRCRLSPYYLACLYYLPGKEKYENVDSPGFLYGAGTLMHLPPIPQERVLSFLPMMNASKNQNQKSKAAKYIELANKYHKQGLQIEEPTQVPHRVSIPRQC